MPGDCRMESLPPYARDPRVDYVLLSEDEIRRRVAGLAREIAAAYPPDRGLYVLAVLTGAFVFAADLARELRRACVAPTRYGFVKSRTYGSNVRGPDAELGGLAVSVDYMPSDLRGQHVLLVDDILDQGVTLARLAELLRGEGGAASLKTCVLLRKELVHTVPSASGNSDRLAVDYVGFDVPDRWVAGYGLDAAGEFRDYPCVVVVKEECFR